MRCVFCKQGSAGSRSGEHILPESIGNTAQVLPPGIVCDKCNNYFSKEVEKRFLETSWARTLRFHQGIVSKKGRIPPLGGVLSRHVPVMVTRSAKGRDTIVDVPTEAIEQLLRSKKGELILPIDGPVPSGPVVSRFLAKATIEAMAQRLLAVPGGIDFLCDERQLDELRNHARCGQTSIWPVNVRRIYPTNAKVIMPNGDAEQVVHEYDFLVTSLNEWYFVLAIFGMEFAINLGGPDVEGYHEWLKENANASPLYTRGKEPFPLPHAS